MNIQVLSDTHFEFHRDGGDAFIQGLNPRQDIDVLVHAGDMCVTGMHEDVIRNICNRFPHFVLVLGNHDYYKSSITKTHEELQRLNDTIDNFHWLHNNIVELNDPDTDEPIKFAGGTMWFKETRAAQMLESQLSDFSQIQGFKPWVYENNKETLDFFADVHKDVDVVVTHHLPHPKSIARQFIGSAFNCYFLCDVPDLLGHVPLWIHGHTHTNADFKEGGTRIVCNPFGYGYENPHFIDEKIIEVGLLASI